jgi:hypothetical protein
MKRIRVASVSLAVVLVAGCGAGTSAPKADPPPVSPSSSAPATASPSISSSPSAKPTPVAQVPQGWHRVRAKKSGLSFAVPKAWTRLEVSTLADPALKATWEKFAKSLGITPEQLKQVFSRIDLMAVSPTLRKADYAEVEVVPDPILAELPTREQLRAQFGQLNNVHVLGFRALLTPVGRGVVAGVSKVVPDQGTVYSQAVFVELQSGVVALTVTAGTPARAREICSTMIASFKDVGRGGAVGNGSAVDG